MENLFAKSVDDLGRVVKFSEKQLSLLQRVDRACEELLPFEFEYYVARKFNEKLPEILRRFDLMGIPVTENYGGLGIDPLVYSLAMERLGQVGMGPVTFLDVQSSLAELTIQEWGTETQKKGYLTPAAKGEKILAYALTEPEAGSDPASMSSTYERQGGSFILNGSKYLISNGSIANTLIVFAYPKGKRAEMTAFLVDSDTEGFSVTMRLEEKIGLFTSDTALLEFRDVHVPTENVLGPIGRGLPVAYSALANGRLGIGSGCIGVIEDCLNASLERARERRQHGKEIGKHQLIQKHIAEIAVNLEMARWPVYMAAQRKREFDESPSKEALRWEVDRMSATAKKIASRLAFESADHALQIFGGFGYSIMSPIGRHFCDARVARIYEGTDEIMELKIASSLLGKEFEAYR